MLAQLWKILYNKIKTSSFSINSVWQAICAVNVESSLWFEQSWSQKNMTVIQRYDDFKETEQLKPYLL